MNDEMGKNSDTAEDTGMAEDQKIQRQRNWKIFGWAVIGLMAVIIILNYTINVEPVINQIAIGVLFLAYIVYVILRKR